MKSTIAHPYASTHPPNAAPPAWLENVPPPLGFEPSTSDPPALPLEDGSLGWLPSSLAFEDIALEVIVSFGNSVLHVAHLAPPRAFCLGESEDDRIADLELPSEAIGRKYLEIVSVEERVVSLCIPEGARGTLSNGQTKLELKEVFERASPRDDGSRARSLPITVGMLVLLELSGVTVRVAVVDRAPALPRGWLANWDWVLPAYFGLSLGTFVSVMGTMAFFTPALGLSDEDPLDQERLLLLSQYLDSAAEREQKRVEAPPLQPVGVGGKEATRARGNDGEAGKANAPQANRRAAISGPADNQELQLARDRALSDAKNFGLVGLLNASQNGDPLGPTSVFGRDLSLGNDDLSAEGNMWGESLGESGGRGGLGLSGDGFGGGDLLGKGMGMGMGEVGTVGHGRGDTGFGMGRGRPGGVHVAKTFSMRTAESTVSGRIPAHVIQRIVRQNFGRFRMCYERGLGRNPNLEGRVAVRFVIGSDGAVATASPGGDIPDAEVKACVSNAFYGLSFPSPEGGGTVRVTYPLMFSPG